MSISAQPIKTVAPAKLTGPAKVSAPKTTKPVSKPTTAQPAPSSTEPVGEIVEGGGHMPVPRPQSSVTDLGSPGLASTRSQPALPAKSNLPAQTAQSSGHDFGGGSRLPRPQSSVRQLAPASTHKPVFAPGPVKASPKRPSTATARFTEPAGGPGGCCIPRPQSTVTDIGLPKASPFQPINPPIIPSTIRRLLRCRFPQPLHRCYSR